MIAEIVAVAVVNVALIAVAVTGLVLYLKHKLKIDILCKLGIHKPTYPNDTTVCTKCVKDITK